MAPLGRVNIKAVASFVLGLAVPLLCFSGIPALILGFIGLREVNRSDGAEKGGWLAIAGMVLGGFDTVLAAVGLTALVFLNIQTVASEATCQNNLRQIGFALQFYYDRTGSFPAGTVTTNEDLRPEDRLSWYTALLPFLGQDSREKLNPNRPWYRLSEELQMQQGWRAQANRKAVYTPIPGLVCPSWTGKLAATEAPITTYVGVAGLGEDAPLLPVEDPRAGVFGYARRTKLKHITRGISDTAMVIETAQKIGPWAAGGPATERPVVPKEAPYIGYERPFGGLHPHLAYMLFVDGSVRPIADTVEPQVFEALATIQADHK
jgi:Protein of unknown function (DUF1559)/Domain of unknown function (DUF4190)